MTDPWDEKPEKTAFIMHPRLEKGPAIAYNADEMDAWLEKLKAYYDVTSNSIQVYEWKEKAEKQDRLENLIIEQEHLLNDMNQKLEAIKNHILKFHEGILLDLWFKELDKILEGEAD